MAKKKKKKVKEVPDNGDNSEIKQEQEQEQEQRDSLGRFVEGNTVGKGSTWKCWRDNIKNIYMKYYDDEKVEEILETAHKLAIKGDTRLLIYIKEKFLKESDKIDVRVGVREFSFGDDGDDEDDEDITINEDDKRDIKDRVAKQVIKEVLLKPYEDKED